jgi:metal-dependent amidase/aminoacylase/carboxypeptidase family protein
MSEKNSEIQVSVVIPEPEEEIQLEPVIVTIPEDNSDELAKLRAYKEGKEAEEAEEVRRIAEEALAVSELALEIAVDEPVEVIEPEPEIEPVIEVAAQDDSKPDIEPNRAHWLYR